MNKFNKISHCSQGKGRLAAGKFILHPNSKAAKHSDVAFQTRSNRMRVSVGGSTSNVSIDKIFPFSFAFPFFRLSWALIDCRSRLGPRSPSVLGRFLPAVPIVCASMLNHKNMQHNACCSATFWWVLIITGSNVCSRMFGCCVEQRTINLPQYETN